MDFTPEMIEKAKTVKTPEELAELAKAAGMELSAESAAAYFEQLNPKTGELTDDDLEDVSGGGCQTKNGKTVVTTNKECFTGRYMPNYVTVGKGTSVEHSEWRNTSDFDLRKLWFFTCIGSGDCCGNCVHLEFKGGTGYCGVS